MTTGECFLPVRGTELKTPAGTSSTCYAIRLVARHSKASIDWRRWRGSRYSPRRMEALAFKRAAEDAEHRRGLPAKHMPWSRTSMLRPARRPICSWSHCGALPTCSTPCITMISRRAERSSYFQMSKPSKTGCRSAPYRQRRAYSLEREPHVVDEKEPDIRMRAPKTDASVPIEIKVAESWTLPELEASTHGSTDRALSAGIQRGPRHTALGASETPAAWLASFRWTMVEFS